MTKSKMKKSSPRELNSGGWVVNRTLENLMRTIDKYGDMLEEDTLARPDLGVDWWTAEYIAENIEKAIGELQKYADELRQYANSGERRPIEEWQNAFDKSAKKSKMRKGMDIDGVFDDSYQQPHGKYVLHLNLNGDSFYPKYFDDEESFNREVQRAIDNGYTESEWSNYSDNEGLHRRFARDDWGKSTKKSKMKKSRYEDMIVHGGRINVSRGGGDNGETWDFADFESMLEDEDDDSALDDLFDKIESGQERFALHRNDGWDYDITVIKSTKKSKNIKKYGERPWKEGDDIAYYIYRDGYRDVGRVDTVEEARRFIWDLLEYDEDGNFYVDDARKIEREYHLVEVNFTIYDHWYDLGMTDIEPEDYEGNWYDVKFVDLDSDDFYPEVEFINEYTKERLIKSVKKSKNVKKSGNWWTTLDEFNGVSYDKLKVDYAQLVDLFMKPNGDIVVLYDMGDYDSSGNLEYMLKNLFGEANPFTGMDYSYDKRNLRRPQDFVIGNINKSTKKSYTPNYQDFRSMVGSIRNTGNHNKVFKE